MLRQRLLAPPRPARRDVGARQVEQVVEVLAHLAIEPAHRRVGPARLVVVGAQVVQDQEPDLVRVGLVEPEALGDRLEHARAHLGVAVEVTLPSGR